MPAAAEGTDAVGGGDGGAIATKAQRPPEEIITLQFDENDRVKVERPQREGKGGGKGKSSGRGRDMATRLMEEAPDASNARKREPKMKPHRIKEGIKKFSRDGPDVPLPGVDNPKLRGRLKQGRKRDEEHVFRLAKSEVLQTTEVGYLEPEGPRDKTFKLCQAALEEGATVGVARKRFSLQLPYGAYDCGFTANGRYLLAGGRKGHVALIHTDTMHLEAELHLKETVRAVKTLHSHLMFAVAQKKYVYMYDQTGMELHCLKDQTFPSHLDFLPYHFLLVTAGERADLHYRDISTGQQVASHRTRLGPTRCMRHNPSNAVVHLGHSNGIVTLWTPKAKEPVAKVFACNGHVTGVAVHDNYMITTGADMYWKVWDLRKYEPLNHFKTRGHAATDVDVSMTGLVSIGFGSHLEVWKDAFSTARPSRPYMTEEYPGKMVTSVRFQPYEDILCVGHSDGFGTLIVPGAGFANYDSYEANPFETKQQRREREVRDLLEKLQPDSIMLDPNQIGNINAEVAKKYREEEEKQKLEEAAGKSKKAKKKMRGRNKVGKRLKRKHLKERQEQRAKTKGRSGEDGGDGSSDEDDDDGEEESDGGAEHESLHASGGDTTKAKAVGTALGRFYGKRRKKT